MARLTSSPPCPRACPSASRFRPSRLSCIRSPTPHHTSGSIGGRPLRVRSAYSRRRRYCSGRAFWRLALARGSGLEAFAVVIWLPAVRPAALRFGGSWVSHGHVGPELRRLVGRAGRTPVEREVELAEQLLARLAGGDQRGGARRRPGCGSTASWRPPGGSRPTRPTNARGGLLETGSPGVVREVRVGDRRLGERHAARGSGSAPSARVWANVRGERVFRRARSGTAERSWRDRPPSSSGVDQPARLLHERELGVERRPRRTARRAARRARSRGSPAARG